MPEQFMNNFKRAGFTEDEIRGSDYYFDIPKDKHRAKAGEGIHTNSSKTGMNWNATWKQFFKDHPDATKKQIIAQLDKMAKDFGIDSYRAKK